MNPAVEKWWYKYRSFQLAIKMIARQLKIY